MSKLDHPPNQLGLRDSEVDLNRVLEQELARNPTKLPKAVWFISNLIYISLTKVPNEFGERFCFYGISPLLNGFFRDYLGLGTIAGIKLSHAFKSMAFFTPLAGAALSELALGKYHTILSLSILYIFGVIITSLFSAPYAFGVMGATPSFWGPALGLSLIAIGTGGIKPCVSSHGGDQFSDSEPKMLNRFYNIFYMFIFNAHFIYE